MQILCYGTSKFILTREGEGKWYDVDYIVELLVN